MNAHRLALPLPDHLIWSGALALIVVVLVIDLLTPAALVIGTLLCGAVAFALLGASSRPVLWLTLLSVLANVIAWLVNAWQDTETLTDFINRSISILTVVLVGLLTSRARLATQRAARLHIEEQQLGQERRLRHLGAELSAPLSQKAFVQRAAEVLQDLTAASSVEIGALERGVLREPYALSLAPDLSAQERPSRLEQAIGSEWLAQAASRNMLVTSLTRADQPELLVMVTSPLTSHAQTRELLSALPPLLERTRLLEVLQHEQNHLAQRGEVLRDLVYAFSHDLRTPLLANSVNMQAALKGAYGPLPDAYRTNLQHGLEANAGVLTLADQLLLIAKYESGEAQGEDTQPVNLRELVLSVMKQVRPRADETRVQLWPELEGVTVPGKPHDLRRAVQNLLENAVKFSPPGGTVTISLTAHLDEARLTVEDQGRGVNSEQQPRLFQRFRGGGAGRGTGLGLYLTRCIAEAHGGSVTYARSSRATSQFTLTLPTRHDPS